MAVILGAGEANKAVSIMRDKLEKGVDSLYLVGFMHGYVEGTKGFHAHILVATLLPQAQGYFDGWLSGREDRPDKGVDYRDDE